MASNAENISILWRHHVENTIDKLLDASEIILFNTYIQLYPVDGDIFKHILGISMGDKSSPFIADVYISWSEYCYTIRVFKIDVTLKKLVSYNCRYLGDICTANLKHFGDIAKDIYDNTLLLEGNTRNYKQGTSLDCYIRVIDDKIVTVIYYQVDDINFDVFSYPFPQSNIHSILGCSTFHSQLILFGDL